MTAGSGSRTRPGRPRGPASPDTSLRLRKSDFLDDALMLRARGAGLTLDGVRLRRLAGQDVLPVVTLEHGREDEGHPRPDGDGSMRCARQAVPLGCGVSPAEASLRRAPVPMTWYSIGRALLFWITESRVLAEDQRNG